MMLSTLAAGWRITGNPEVIQGTKSASGRCPGSHVRGVWRWLGFTGLPTVPELAPGRGKINKLVTQPTPHQAA